MSNPYSVVLDSCVLAKKLHRNVLLNLAAADCFRPIWSDTILAETESAINSMGGDGAVLRRRLETIFQSANADPAYIHLVHRFQLRDPDDRHVVAVALQEHADAICTDNAKDFRLSTVEVLTADEFITDTIDLSVVKSINALAAMRKKIAYLEDGSGFLDLLERRELVETATYLRRYADRL